ncbi:MAG: outer membrane beta-barrel protein [Terricaulis sp.]
MIGRMMVSALALTGIAYAQEAPSAPACDPDPTCAATPLPTSPSSTMSGRIAYDAAFFAQYNPQNALDMVRQTPGFTLDGGDGRRGFSGAVGNLLIDGVRPTAKSQSLDSILSRIPARQVLRVEVLSGAETSGDASGQSVLLNLVRTPTAGSGIWRAGAEYNGAGTGPQGELSYNGRVGQFEYGVGVDYYSHYREQPGIRRYFDNAGVLERTADTPSPRDYREGSLTANAALPLFGGRLSANAQYYRNRFHPRSGFFFHTPAGAPDGHDLDALTEQQQNLEIGVNYDREFGPWSLALVGLANRGRYRNEEAFSSFNAGGGFKFAFGQDIDNENGETIARGSLSRDFGKHRFEIGAESAFNTLDASLVFTLDEGAGPEVQPIENSNVLVEEERAEAFAVHTWRPSSGWAIETRLAGESSTLTFSGGTDKEVEFAFFKPSVQLSRDFGGNDQLRLRVYRDIGQLDFNDFVSAAGLTDARIEGGNPDLRPQTTWRAELAADFRFPGNGALSLTLTRHWIEDLADLVKLTDTRNTPAPADDVSFDAPGNIGKADAWSLETQLTLPLRAIIPGAQITAAGTLWQTEVLDPITGRVRDFSNRAESEISVEFRQDLNALRLAWGVTYFKQSEFTGYRFNETDTYEEGPWIDAYIESTAIEGVRLRLVAANIFDGEINRERRFFTPDRAGALDNVQTRFREFDHDPWFVFSASGSF